MSDRTLKRLSKRERKKRLKELRRRERQREARIRSLKKWGGIVTLVLAIVALGYGGYRWVLGAKYYPPTDIAGHTEDVPPGHILNEPMPLAVQKHMLEHADGSGPPGVIINYNCEDFTCEPDLIERLAEIAQEYPSFVYLAPFPGMDAKIALTRLGELEVLDSFDEERIRAFIER
jgi:hypothetical protein